MQGGVYRSGRSIGKKLDLRTVVVYRKGLAASTVDHETLHSMGIY